MEYDRARLQKAADSDTICAFSGGGLSLTTPDGVTHSISLNVPCIGGTGPAEGCSSFVDSIQSALIPYKVHSSDVVGGLITATASYTGGVVHDQSGNTPGVGVSAPRSSPVVFCNAGNVGTGIICDPSAPGPAACENPDIPAENQDPPGCFETGAAVVVSALRANGTTAVAGSVSECETFYYRARLQKAEDSDTICALSGGTFSLTTPDGVVHLINLNVPCIGGTNAADGCSSTVDFIASALIPYTVTPSAVVDGRVAATASYTGGVAHDQPGRTPGVGASTPKGIQVAFCDAGLPCTIDTCDPTKVGAAACGTAPFVCEDLNSCTVDTCDPATGLCVFTALNCDDGLFCNGSESCQEGVCVAVSACPPFVDGCLVHTGACDEENDACVVEREPLCDDTCRTAGFWSTHGGTERRGSNATDAVLSPCGCVSVCGEVIDNTELNDASSAIEALCISPSGDPKLQLARQLTALALNCCASGFGGDCASDPVLRELFATCNNTCLGDDGAAIQECTFRIDCYNQGGLVLENGSLYCQTGTCQVVGNVAQGSEAPCNSGALCPSYEVGAGIYAPQECVALEGSCHGEEICNEEAGYCFGATPPASSSTKCSDAQKAGGGTKKQPLHCTVLPPGEGNCAEGLMDLDGFECCSDANCEDGSDCTADQCHSNGECSHEPVSGCGENVAPARND